MNPFRAKEPLRLDGPALFYPTNDASHTTAGIDRIESMVEMTTVSTAYG